ncbi:MAG: dihydrofolate reductase family protein [Rhodospirillales bacterium]|nr:dihydrofolate reductase family protein [Alphaproteobacteria bacterium]USO03624.1 MAG: dihydrofolate reductase family protein [Rhodospirillales bacterium]
MTVTIFMNMSADGFIAKEDNSVPFISDEEWKVYVGTAQKSDALIVGRHTYDEMIKAGDFNEIGTPRTIVVTQNDQLTSPSENVFFSSESPENIIYALNKEGLKNILVCGGAQINALFLKEKCVNKINICISPYLLGGGIPFLKEDKCETDLSLESFEKIGNGSVLLKYKIENHNV